MNSSDPAPFIASFGGTFLGDAGLVIDPSTGVIDLSSSTPGLHEVQYQIGGSCPASSTIQITIVPPPVSDWIAPQQLCSNSDPIELNTLLATGAITGGNWSGPGVQNGIFDPAGITGAIMLEYTVLVGSCSSSTIHPMDMAPAPIAFAGPPASVCGNEIEMDASTAAQGTWILPEGVVTTTPDSPTATLMAGDLGSYDVTWSVTANGCMDQHTTTITFMDPATDIWVDAGPDRTITIQTMTELSGNASPGTTTTWNTIDGNGTITGPSALSTSVHGLSIGTNRFTLTARAGSCAIAIDTVTVFLKEFFIPAGFSPNNDGVNDFFEITGLDNFPGTGLHIFNRWGQEVLSSADYRNDWNGRSDNGNELPNDTYFYVLNLGGGNTYNGYVIIKR